MKRLIILLPVLLGLPALALAEKEKKEGLFPKVEKPIADTYQPLDGADWNHRTSEELRELREYQSQKKEQERSEYEAERRKALEAKIQAPDPGASPASSPPQIEEESGRIRIKDTE